MPVDELVPIKVVVDALERGLHPARHAFMLQDRDQEVRGPIPRLTAVEIGEVIVQRHHRGEDAFLAFGVERVEIVGDPVTDRAAGADASGHQREMPAVRLIVVALRPVQHHGKRRSVGPAPRRTGASFPERRCRERALRTAARLAADQRAQCGGRGVDGLERRVFVEPEVLGPDRACSKRPGARTPARRWPEPACAEVTLRCPASPGLCSFTASSASRAIRFAGPRALPAWG